MEFLIDYFKENTILLVFYLTVWILIELWMIRHILQSKDVNSKVERALWILLCIVTYVAGMILFFDVTNRRHRKKYHPTK